MLAGPAVGPVLDRVTPLAERFRTADRRVHLVGGVVRDLVLGRSSVDLDLTTDARPAQIKALVSGWADDVWSQGERFGTIGCRHGDDVYEITTYRADAYDPASRKPVVEFGDTLEGDLVRRDFTINAMALDPTSAELVDPHDGRRDLEEGVLRTPGPPDVSFDDDPLRMLRAARFVARFGLVPTDELLASMRRHAPRLGIVSAERIHDELLKLLDGPDPAVGLRVLDEQGLLELFLPEADVDAVVLGRLDDPIGRLAGLLRHAPVDALRARLSTLRASKAEAAAVVRTVSGARGALAAPAIDPSMLRRLALDARESIDGVRALVAAVDPERGAALDAAWSELVAVEDLGAPPLVDGAAVQRTLGVEPGRIVGEALAHLEAVRIDEGPLPEAEQLDRLRAWWAARSDG